jgi:lipoate-protein ligase B
VKADPLGDRMKAQYEHRARQYLPRRTYTIEYVDKRTGETRRAEDVERRVWTVEAPPVFTQDREFLARVARGYREV